MNQERLPSGADFARWEDETRYRRKYPVARQGDAW